MFLCGTELITVEQSLLNLLQSGPSDLWRSHVSLRFSNHVNKEIGGTPAYIIIK